MQDIVEGLISRLVNGDPALIKIADKISVEKRDKELRKVIGTDAESVFDVIETYDTLKDSCGEK
jgi:hypothetical protein